MRKNPKTNIEERTVENLLRLKGRVYVYSATAETARRFFKDAESEGFTFGDGAKPSEREISDIIAINADKTMNYTGFIGHLAFGCAESAGGEKLIRVDYQKYADGDADYLLMRDMFNLR